MLVTILASLFLASTLVPCHAEQPKVVEEQIVKYSLVQGQNAKDNLKKQISSVIHRDNSEAEPGSATSNITHLDDLQARDDHAFHIYEIDFNAHCKNRNPAYYGAASRYRYSVWCAWPLPAKITIPCVVEPFGTPEFEPNFPCHLKDHFCLTVHFDGPRKGEIVLEHDEAVARHSRTTAICVAANSAKFEIKDFDGLLKALKDNLAPSTSKLRLPPNQTYVDGAVSISGDTTGMEYTSEYTVQEEGGAEHIFGARHWGGSQRTPVGEVKNWPSGGTVHSHGGATALNGKKINIVSNKINWITVNHNTILVRWNWGYRSTLT